MLTTLVLIAGAATLVGAAWVGVSRPELRAIAVRNVRLRPGRALLVATGVLLATATLTSAATLGDSLRSSIRRSAFTQLGPVDEEVIGAGPATTRSITTALDRARIGGIDGVVSFVSLTTTAQGRDFVPRVAQAQVIELDFGAAKRFGGDPAATGISGPTPSGSGAVMSADLADQIAIQAGHRVTIHAFGTSRTFRVSRIIPRLGLAGIASPRASAGSSSPNIFVPLGTIESMRRASGQTDAPGATVVVAVSNRGGVLTSSRASTAVTAALRRATSELAVEVLPAKQLLLDDAATESTQFGGTFRVFGIFSALGGLLLLLLTFSALARERARSLGILRAIGLRRRDMIATLVLEALLCCILGVVIGAAVGVGIAALVVVAAHGVLGNAAAGGVDLAFAFRATSVAAAAAIGLVVSITALLVTAVVLARGEVVALMHGTAGSGHGVDPRRLRTLGAGVAAAGVVIAAAGIAGTNTITAVVGAAAAVLGATLATPSRWQRAVTVAGATGLLIWTVLAVRVGHRVFSGPAPAELLTIAVAMSFAAVALVSIAHQAIAQRHGAAGRRRTAPLALGFAYSHATPNRTAIISSMYAVVVFTLCLVATIAHVYAGSVDIVARELGGAAQLEVTSNAAQPVADRDVRQLPGVTRVTGASALDAHLLARGRGFTDVRLIGVGAALVDHGTPPIAVTLPALRGSPLYRRVVSDPTLVVVGADLRTTPQNSLDHRTPHVGDALQIQDPTTGIARRVRIAGLVADARYEGVDHVYVADVLIDRLHAAPVAKSVLYVETAPGTNNDTVAAIIDGTHLPNGAYARSFRRLANDRLTAQRQFLNILSGYTALGLLGGAAALAVAMIDRVRERRRQLAMLRAIGCRRSTIRRALRIEAVLIGLEGTLAGAFAATVLTWRLATTGALGDSLPFSVPGIAIGMIIATAVVTALAATTVAARRAARLQPAGALRAEE